MVETLTAMARAVNTGGGLFALIFTWISFVGVCGGDPVCDKWSGIAQAMTGNGKFQTCTRSNTTAKCAQIFCEGSFMERGIPELLEIDYCFGFQLNSCLQPLSMDFYLKVPSHNYSKQLRIRHDQVVQLPDFDSPMLKVLNIKPLLDFMFERNGSNSVLMSVTLKVRSSIGPIYFDEFERKVIREEALPVQPCADGLKNDVTGVPPADFLSVPCHAEKYPSEQPKVIVPVDDVKPSVTLNKTCSFNLACSSGETCQLTSATEGICDCESDYYYVPEKEVCVSRGSVGRACLSMSDCGLYEVCERDGGSAASLLACRCEESYHWDDQRSLCIVDPHHQSHSHTHSKEDTTGGEGDKAGSHTTTTTTPANRLSSTNSSANPSHHGNPKSHQSKHKADGSDTEYMIIGVASAGVAVVVAITIATVLLCRRRRRNNLPGGGGLYDSHGPMLADTDDVDLVM